MLDTAQLYCTTSTGPSVGGIAQQPVLPASIAGHGISYTPALVLLAVAGIVASGRYVQRKREV
jgi:hypothetical protein